MPDNLNIKGIESDEFPQGARRIKARGKRRKPWGIEWRIERHVSNSLAENLGLYGWSVYNRYTTKARRDQAYAALVKKDATSRLGRSWWQREFRTFDDG